MSIDKPVLPKSVMPKKTMFLGPKKMNGLIVNRMMHQYNTFRTLHKVNQFDTVNMVQKKRAVQKKIEKELL